MPEKQNAKKSPPRRPLSRERILKAALVLADKQGIAALSMRNIAAALGVEAMSLYKHVANKDDVLDGLVDILLAEIERPPEVIPWREAMRLRAFSARRTILRHPWGSVLIESRTTPSDARLRYGEDVLSFLARAGFSTELQYRAFLTLDSYVYGFVLQEVNWPKKESARSALQKGLKQFLKQSPYPNLTNVLHHFAALRPVPGEEPYDAEFAFGLELILDGLQRKLEEQASS